MSEREIVEGPVWEARNWSINAGSGSIHDDATASKLGFRGGTVAGSVHMNQFPPVLMQVFGFRWFEQGHLSLDFKNATVDMESVQAFAEKPEEGETQTRVWMERTDGLQVCIGTAGMGNQSRSALRSKDLRPCDPSELRILANVHAGMHLGSYDEKVSSERQFDLFDRHVISDPLDFYRTGSHWGGPIACPSTMVQTLYGIPIAGLRPHLGNAVGLFGAIEVGHVNGPLLLDREYHLESKVVCVGQSPKTEYLWFDTSAFETDGGQEVANMRMMLRFMKASSPHYEDENS